MIKFKSNIQHNLNVERDWVKSIRSDVTSNFKRNNVILFIALSFYLFQPISVYSQDSLLYYLEISARNNPVVLQKYAEYQAALEKVPQVGSLPDPELTTGIFLSPMELVAGKQVADIRLMQMFPWFGVLKNAKDEMGLMARAKFESFRDAKVQLFFELQRTWYDLVRIRQNIRISEENIRLLQTIERLVIVRFKAGPSGGSSPQSGSVGPLPAAQGSSSLPPAMNKMGSSQGNSTSGQTASPMPGNPMSSSLGGSGLADVYRIQIETGDLQNSIDQFQTQLTTISAKFNSYLNRKHTSLITVPDTLIALTFQPLALSDTLLANNPMLGMLRFEQLSLEARKQMVTRMGYPMVGIGLNYSLINKNEMSATPMNGRDMVMPMVTLTLPIYRKKYKALRSEAEFLKSANLHNYIATVNDLQNEYYQALQLFQDSQRRIQLYVSQHQLASKSLGLLVKSFATSGSSLTDILRVRQQLLDYENKKIDAVADNNISVAWIKKLSCIE